MANERTAGRPEKAVPTNTIVYKGRKIPAMIDAGASLNHIIEVMAKSFDTSEHHITLCLRDESDHVVTQSKLANKVANKELLKLVSSPTTEALSVISALKSYLAQPSHGRTGSIDTNATITTTGSASDAHSGDAISIKLALFNLSRYIKEEEFAVEFMLKGGMKMLVKILESNVGGLSGNSLAYALQGVRGIMEFEAGWNDISIPFIDKVLTLLATSTSPNILRPATAITRKFVYSAPHLQNADIYATPGVRDRRRRGPSKGKEREILSYTNLSGADEKFGFESIWGRMGVVGQLIEGEDGWHEQEIVFRNILKRLEGAGDLELVSLSLSLLNACLRTADEDECTSYPALIGTLEQCNIRKHVTRLMTSSSNALEPQILGFQARWTAVLHQRRLTPVRPAKEETHEKMLNDIYTLGRLGSPPNRLTHSPHSSINNIPEPIRVMRSLDGWRRLGLGDDEMLMQSTESALFRDVGELGLECLHWFAIHDENFASIVGEQEARAIEKRCPIGKASAECVKLLCEHYKIAQAGHAHPTQFQVFLLHLPRFHHILLTFFLRMWKESESRLSDFSRLSNLVRSQLSHSLASESSKTWADLEKDLLEMEYQTIRERQMESLEQEDGMMHKEAIRDLRDSLSRDVYQVIADQRIGCMLQGSWFNAATLVSPGVQSTIKSYPSKPFRFVRLSPNRKMLAWGDFQSRPAVNPEYDSLRDHIDISNITSVSSNTAVAINSRSPNLASKLSFSLLAGSEISLLDLAAIHSAQFAEWTDGITVLKKEGGMKSGESAGFVKVLTEIALKVRLLDITGDGVEISDKLICGPAPRSVDFWFAK